MRAHTHTWALMDPYGCFDVFCTFAPTQFITTFSWLHPSFVSELLVLQLNRRSTARSSEIQGTISGNPTPHVGVKWLIYGVGKIGYWLTTTIARIHGEGIIMVNWYWCIWKSSWRCPTVAKCLLQQIGKNHTWPAMSMSNNTSRWLWL